MKVNESRDPVDGCWMRFDGRVTTCPLGCVVKITMPLCVVAEKRMMRLQRIYSNRRRVGN